MILSKWAGDSEKAVSQVFDLARTMQPSILFLVGAQHCCSVVSCPSLAAIQLRHHRDPFHICMPGIMCTAASRDHHSHESPSAASVNTVNLAHVA
jgi:hypothetical protein